MQEKIVLAPGASGSELIRSLAEHGGDTFNLRLCTAGELARLALIRSGIGVPEEFVSVREEKALISAAVRSEPCFAEASWSDVKEIAAAVRTMRCLVPAGDEEEVLAATLPRGPFAKNRALLQVYRNYRRELAARHAIDTVDLIRRAAAQSETLDAVCICLEEFPLLPVKPPGGKPPGFLQSLPKQRSPEVQYSPVN